MSRKEKNIVEIQLRKQKLQDEIDSIEQKYSKKATKISNGIQKTLKPIKTIRENPLKSVGVSIALGVIVGLSGRRKKKSDTSSSDYPVSSGTSGTGFTNLLMSELKRMAAKRAMMYISDIIDQRVMPEIRNAQNSGDDAPKTQGNQ